MNIPGELWVVLGSCLALVVVIAIFKPRRVKIGSLEYEAEGAPPAVKNKGSPIRKSILTHNIFLKKDSYLATIRAMGGPSPKDCVNRAFLLDCKFESIYNHLERFTKNVVATDGAELENFPKVLYHIIQDYGNKARSLEIRIGDRIVCGVPRSYIVKFDKWHSPHVKILMDGIDKRLRDSYYYDWWTTATSCLDLLDIILQLTIEDAGLALGEINGELDREIQTMLCRDEPAKEE